MGQVSGVLTVSRGAPCTISASWRVNDPADSVKIPFDTIVQQRAAVLYSVEAQTFKSVIQSKTMF